MLHDLLIEARDQAEKSEPMVRVAALLRIARVESAVDREKSRETFDQTLAEIRRITGQEGNFFLEHARLIAAAVAPDLLPDIVSFERMPRRFSSESVGRIMLDHQHQRSAFDYVVGYDQSSSFPFGVAAALMRTLDPDSRLAVLRSSIAAWRTARESMPMNSFQFISLFQSHWKALPSEEAAEVLHEIVGTVLNQPDHPISASYDPEGTTRITSARAHTLFEIIHILQQLDAPLAESLIADHEQLATVLRRFPNGMASVMEEAEARRAEVRRTGGGGGYGMAGSPKDFPYMRALIQSSRDSDFGPAIQHAVDKYREDADPEHPNRAPKEFWPSARRFRSVLYEAGKHLGDKAVLHLDAVPDSDLRLFAQIELAAALAGLPELPGIRREMGLRPDRSGRMEDVRTMRAPSNSGAAVAANIRCPKCQWSPNAESRWSCRCRHLWNTFGTRGLCPACGYQWTVTSCLNCGQASPHSDWYAKE
jgi:hypothetical protein